MMNRVPEKLGFGSATVTLVFWVLLKQVIHVGLFDDFTKFLILIKNFEKMKKILVQLVFLNHTFQVST